MSNNNKKNMNKKQLTFNKTPLVLHPFNDHVENFVSVNGVTLQNIPLSKFGKMGISKIKDRLIIFDFLGAFRVWNDQEASLVDKVLSYYKKMCQIDKQFHINCLFVGNSQIIREMLRITECPSQIIMIAEKLESAAFMAKISRN